MMRERLRRERPGLSAEEVEARLIEWLQQRPGAELADASGRPVPWPRRSR
ncbi:MAG TPA: hypothetical protein VFC42_06220 [Methylomirabilota bacterium]|nr:hypothetical protein [Methylomirabilota bacterium]